jgi:hypothetical protein
MPVMLNYSPAGPSMDTTPNFEPPPVTHRRRHSTAWQRTPKWVKISVAVCLVLLTISLLEQDRIMDLAKTRRETGTGQAVEPARAPRVDIGKAFDSITSKLSTIDLELTGTSLNFKTRRIEGAVVNKSEHPYSNIRVTFALPSADFSAQDQTIVTIAKLAPHASSRFVSDVVPDEVRQWALVEITGTPR